MRSPMIDDLLRMFSPFDAGLLIGITEIIENPSHVGTAVINVPFFADEVGDDAGSPTFGLIAGGDGSFAEDCFEFVELCGREFGFRTTAVLSSEGGESFAFDFFAPALDAGEGDLENLHNLFVVKAS